jgi:hypothetical protein
MIGKAVLLAVVGMMLAACTNAGVEAVPVAGAGACRNDGLDGFVGKTASAELGAEMLRMSGATVLRWGAPGTAMTMDYREDRLTVSYDGAMVITSARCG